MELDVETVLRVIFVGCISLAAGMIAYYVATAIGNFVDRKIAKPIMDFLGLPWDDEAKPSGAEQGQATSGDARSESAVKDR